MIDRTPLPRSFSALERRFLEFANTCIRDVEASCGADIANILTRFLRLYVLHDFRNNARLTHEAARASYSVARARLNAACKFAKYLAVNGKSVKTYARNDIDRYLESATQRNSLRVFLRWLVENQLASRTSLIPFKRSASLKCLDDVSYYDQMNRLFKDESIKVATRCYAIAYVMGFKPRFILAVKICDLDLRKHTIYIGGMCLALEGELLELFASFRRKRLGLRKLKDESERFLFAKPDSDFMPSSLRFGQILRRHKISILILRNTATRMSLQLLPEYLGFAETTKQSVDAIFRLAAHYNGRAGSYVSVLGE